MERLTSYENECNREMICRYEDCCIDEEYCPHLNEDNCLCLQEAIKRLAEYEDLEEQGLLVKPKCKPGDIVWETNRRRNIISEYEVVNIRYDIDKKIHYMWRLRSGVYSNLFGCWDKDFGKTVFLTRAEAEEALKEWREKKLKKQNG